MKKILFFLACCGTLTGANVDFGIGVRRDYVQWSIGMHPYSPNILSELKWEDIWSLDAFLSGSGVVYKNIVVDAFLNAGKIVSGHVWDRDYWGNNRTQMFSESRSNADTGYVLDSEVGLSSSIPLLGGVFTDRVGYGYHKLHLSMIGGWHSDIANHKLYMPLTLLNSRYSAQFFGPYIGFNYQKSIGSFLGGLGYTYSFVQYRGEGYWNLRPEFTNNFVHKSDKGFGHSFYLNLQMPLTDNLQGGLSFIGRSFKVYNGVDHVYFVENGHEYHAVQKLVDVHWIDLSFYLYMQYIFDLAPQRLSARERLTHILKTKQ